MKIINTNSVLLSWILILVVAASTIIPVVQSTYYSRSVPYKPVPEKKTNLRVYIHDILTGNNPSAIQIAGPKDKNDPIPFGSTFAIDDLLTDGPNITSNVVGNARGIWMSGNREGNRTLVLYIDLGFTSGEFKGSSLSVFSRNPIMDKVREMAVVGGRGKFRMAKGFVEVRSVYLNESNGDAVLEYSVEVVHPC